LYLDDTSSESFFSTDFPKKDTPRFNNIRLFLQKNIYYDKSDGVERKIDFQEFDRNNKMHYEVMELYETGKLAYGNANPSARDFNSLADFCAGDGFVEIKLPWQLLSFSDPVDMKIHDDYYEHYGVEYLKINEIKVGVGDGDETIMLKPYALEKMGKKLTYHERLKKSYYILQEYWNSH